ncbi:MAG: hypothetical protein KGV59_07310 [Tenacibaculum sp.]|nr:hypothetical protein [Tenacibaculum sp.]
MIEKKTAKAVLQEKEPITINGKTYKVAPPSIATLMLVSKEIAVLPKDKLNDEQLFQEVFKNVDFGENIARSLAIMVLGAKRVNKISKLKRLFKQKTELEKLTLDILNAEISEVLTMYVKIMSSMQVQDFFMLITFLNEITLTKPTKKVIKTTVSGRSSEDL